MTSFTRALLSVWLHLAVGGQSAGPGLRYRPGDVLTDIFGGSFQFLQATAATLTALHILSNSLFTNHHIILWWHHPANGASVWRTCEQTAGRGDHRHPLLRQQFQSTSWHADSCTRPAAIELPLETSQNARSLNCNWPSPGTCCRLATSDCTPHVNGAW